jgi:hypothetical protein
MSGLLLAAIGLFLWTSGEEKLKEREPSRGKTEKPLPDTSERLEVTAPSGPSDPSSPQSDEALPNKLRQILRQVRASSAPQRKAWEEAILLAWSDFKSAADFLAREFPEDREERKAHLLLMIGDEDLQAAQKGLQWVSSAACTMAVVSRLAAMWAVRDQDSALAFARQLDGDFRNHALSDIGRVMIQNGQFSQADQLLQEMAYSTARSQFLGDVARRRSLKDPYEALLWVNSFDRKEDKKNATDAVISEAVPRLSTEQLLELANTTEDQSVRSMCTSGAAEKLARVNAPEAAAWAERLPEDVREIALLRITRTWGSSDGAAATAYVLGKPDLKVRATAIYEIGKEITRHDPRAAAEWIDTLPAEFQIRSAVGLTHEWYSVDSMAVTKWIDGLPPGPVKDRSIMSLAYCVKRSEPDKAVELAATIKDSELRQSILADIQRK